MSAKAKAVLSFSHDQAVAAFARAKVSRNANPVGVAKTFYYEVYRRLVADAQDAAVCVVQNNNLTAAEYRHAKLALNARGFTVCGVRNGLLAAAVRDHLAEAAKDGNDGRGRAAEARAARPDAKGKEKGKGKGKGPSRIENRFARLLVGPSFIVFPTASASEGPAKPAAANPLARLVAALAPESLSPAVAKKTLVAGALVQNSHVLSRLQLIEAAKLPTLQRSREELVGLLSAPAAQLKAVLERTPQSLVATLNARE
ncbi:hypothetical protein HK100_009581 [Physocladia obscura]|uniref:50S ribosomal protein L10 n=1 Tax=Physocladia obscura TaxID=109957 RepID=A0AAD5T497_9FUNG|nr:hypothetical protein HK100_009581 [Physocladia obscura]